MTKKSFSRSELLEEFDAAPPSTLFSQKTLCAILDCSPALVERNRWAGAGCPFTKIGHMVRYRKSDILAYLGQQKTRHSTVEANAEAKVAGGDHVS